MWAARAARSRGPRAPRGGARGCASGCPRREAAPKGPPRARGHAEDPQVPGLHAVRGELERRLHNLPVGLVEPSPCARRRACILQRPQQSRVGAGRGQDLHGRVAARGAGSASWARLELLGLVGDAERARAGGLELLADHPQGKELVALQAQDGAQALDLERGVEPVAAGRPLRRDELLVLEVADLRDRDRGEVRLQQLADGADQAAVGPACTVGGGSSSGMRRGSVIRRDRSGETCRSGARRRHRAPPPARSGAG